MQAFFRGISFRLAKVGVILAFFLGFAMSSLQLYLDLASQQEDLDHLVQQVIEVATPPAARAVHTLDNDLSQEVVNGLLDYNFIFRVEIVDELGNTLASGESEQQATSTRWLTRWITEDPTPVYPSPLIIPGYDDSVRGSLVLHIDVDRALSGFFARSGLIIGAGMLRNMLLVLMLFYAFYTMLTQPLIRLSKEIQQIDADKPGERRLTPLSKNRDDELAQVIFSSNHLLDAVELSLAKRKAVELALRKSEEHVRQIIDSLPVMIGARNSEGRYIFANKALSEFMGRSPKEMQNCHISELLPQMHTDIEDILRVDHEIINNSAPVQSIEEIYKTQSGDQSYWQTHIMPLDFYDEVVALVVSNDVTESRHVQAKMEYMAYHDALTNLPNRVHLVERLEHEIRRAKRHNYHGALLFIDLDQFKTINDSLGHPVGDKVLKEVALRLRASVRDEDLVARLSGDEFVVVLTVLDQDISSAALKAGEIGEKIRHSLSVPYPHDDMELRITCSVGVVVYPDRGSSVHELLRYADTAMYQVKEKGRDAIEFFNEDMADKVSRQLVMEGDLHRALDDEQFELFYQPKVDVATGAIVGAEALLRWQHPEKGTISPADFIPVLETSGMILDVGQWVLEQAARALQRWDQAGLWDSGMRLSVNVSPRQFRHKGFADGVEKTLQAIPIPPDSLDIEITEGIVIHNVDETISTMEMLTAQGVSFSLDDFGTGYSSISYLKRLPVNVLKIDQSFVRDLMDDRNDRVLVETMVTMGRLLGLQVVAEGVEQREQLNLLKEYGCDYYQGYLCSPAVGIVVFEDMLRAEDKRVGNA